MAEKLAQKILFSYKSGIYYYPAEISRRMEISTKDAYLALEYLHEKGYVEQVLLISCPHCHKDTDQYFSCITDIPETVSCPHCMATIKEPAFHATVVYKEKL